MEKYQFPKIKDEIQFENFTRDLLNLIYQDNSFYLYGRKGQSQYGLDGYSTVHPIFFQCKHKSSPHVKDKKLEEELEAELNKAKSKIEEVSNSTESKFLFFTTHPNATKLQDKAKVLSTNNIIVEYWGWETIESHLNNLYLSKHREFFSKYYPELAKILTTSKISPQLTTKLGKSTLIGRKKELQEIAEQLKASKTLLVKGIGGVGKSTIASNYLHRHKDEYDYYGFFEGLESFESQLELAFKLKIEQGQDRLDRVLHELIELEPESNKLLVIDDVKEIEDNQEKLEKILGLKHNGYKVLLTSREEIEDVAKYDLDVLSMNDAKKLFKSIHKVKDEMLLEEILGYLDFHTLFIEMTAKTLNIKERLSLPKLIDKFRKQDFTIIKRDDIKSYHKFLDNFPINEVILNNEENLLFIKKISVLPSIEISFEKLYQFLVCDDEDKLEEFLIILVRNGWLVKFKDRYKLHQVLRDYILYKYPPTFEEIEIMVDSFNTLIDNSSDAKVAVDNRENIVYFESLITLLDRLEMENEKIGKFFNNFGLICEHLGFYQRTESLYLKSLKIRENLLEIEHPNTAVCYNNLAKLYGSMGKYQKAEPLYLKALEILEKVLGEEHPNTATSYNNLASVYDLMGAYQKAEPLYLKALKINEKLLGEEHPNTASSYNNLAGLYELMRAFKKSESLYLKSLKIRKKVLEEEHPDTASSYNNLAQLYKSMKKHKKAELFYLKALKIRENILGDEHPDTAQSYNNLAVSYYSQGDFEKAYPYVKKAVEVLSKVLPSNHPYLIEAKKGLEMIEGRL